MNDIVIYKVDDVFWIVSDKVIKIIFSQLFLSMWKYVLSKYI